MRALESACAHRPIKPFSQWWPPCEIFTTLNPEPIREVSCTALVAPKELNEYLDFIKALIVCKIAIEKAQGVL